MSLPYAFRADGVWGIDLDTPQVLASNLPGKPRSNLYWFRIQSEANPHTKEIAKGKPQFLSHEELGSSVYRWPSEKPGRAWCRSRNWAHKRMMAEYRSAERKNWSLSKVDLSRMRRPLVWTDIRRDSSGHDDHQHRKYSQGETTPE